MMNEHVKKYLDYYLDLKYPPEYAILLRGEWGCGKSFFIKNYIKKKKKKKKYAFLYISLYGVSSKANIDDLIFQQIHPFLASKGMKIFSGVVKGLLKTTFRFDIDGDSKPDFNITSTLPEIEMLEKFKKAKNKILVFDDVERSLMDITEILGYINQLVENDGQKAILVANEKEIEKNNIEESYKLVKEKLIGKNFDIIQNKTEAYKEFISNLKSDVKIFLNKREALVLSVYESSGYNNLRHLKQSLEYFEIFFQFLPKEFLEKDALINHIVDVFFIISIEIKAGKIDENSIRDIFPLKLLNPQKDKELYLQLKKKYSILDKNYHPITIKIWKYFFKYATVREGEIKESILNSEYFVNERTPSWRRLWYFFNLEDSDFDIIEKDVFNKLKNSLYDNQYEVIHSVGILLNLLKTNLIEYEKKDILEFGRKNILKLKDQNKIEVDRSTGELKYVSGSLKYQSLDDRDFLEFIDFVNIQAEKLEENKIQKLADVLHSTLKKSVDKFGREIAVNNSERNKYFAKPILKHIPCSKFCQTIINMSNRDIKKLNIYIEQRYNYQGNCLKLLEERKWLEDLMNLLAKEVEGTPQKISKIIVEGLIVQIKKSIENLNSSIETQG